MNTKQELQYLTSKLDKSSHKLTAAKERGDQAMVLQFQTEIEAPPKAIANAKNQNDREVSGKSNNIKALAFNRELTKEEQAKKVGARLGRSASSNCNWPRINYRESNGICTQKILAERSF